MRGATNRVDGWRTDRHKAFSAAGARRSAIAVGGSRGVAQPGSALGSGPRSRRFKSSRPDSARGLAPSPVSRILSIVYCVQPKAAGLRTRSSKSRGGTRGFRGGRAVRPRLPDLDLEPGSQRDASASYRIALASQRDASASYRIGLASYRIGSASQRDASASYRIASASYRIASASYRIASASQRDRPASQRDASASYPRDRGRGRGQGPLAGLVSARSPPV